MSRLCFIIFLSYISTPFFAQDTIEVNIDFGGSDTELPWNTLTNSTNGLLENLIETNETSTEIDISVSDDFNGTNTNGTLTADANLNFPAFASGDSFFGNQLEWNGTIQETAAITLSDLDINNTYNLTLFASRSASDDRETQYIITGSTDTTLLLNAASNQNEVVTAINIAPDANGEIDIQVSAGPNNDNEFGFYYLGIMRIQYEGIIEEIEPALSLTSPTGGEFYQTGKTPQIRWESQGIDEVLLEFSTDAGNTWNGIETVNALNQEFDWTIPNLDSEDCLVRISGDTITKVSVGNFTINNTDTTACHIVVLGSSTAAGTGPSSLDSAWVWMYRDTLFQNDTRFTVTNLARGGFTTYNILPTDSEIPTGVNQTIDEIRNVTQALSLNPNAIIINLPSNDAANGYTVETQLENYDHILAELDQLEIPYWICTPQPRNGFSDVQKLIQTDLRDSTYSIFGEFAIDFWSTLATVDDNVDDLFNSGDGVHLNNAGHQILIERVLERNINSFLLELKDEGTSSILNKEVLPLKIFPNPTDSTVNIMNLLPPYTAQVYTTDGKLLMMYDSYDKNVFSIPLSGQYYILISKENKKYGAWVIIK